MVEQAERVGDLGRAAELRYGTMIQLESTLTEENRRLQQLQSIHKMLKEEVDKEDICEVLAKWTRIPVVRIMEAEVTKLTQMETRLCQRVVGQEEGEVRARAFGALQSHFSPEFLNRIDDIEVFHPLGMEQLRQIIDIQMKSVAKRLLAKQITLTLTDEAKRYLAREGYDPTFGARPLKRVIQRDILNPLSMKLLDGTFKEGDRIIADVEVERLVFRMEGEGPVPGPQLLENS
jgi:ATP-dependent Clp protease ATP-binding subunit ClpA